MLTKRLIELRKEVGLTQKGLADKLKITRSALSLYELGKRTPDTKTLSDFADFFGVSVDYLLGRSNIRNPYELEKFHNTLINTADLPDEAIKQIESYIQFIKQKYIPE